MGRVDIGHLGNNNFMENEDDDVEKAPFLVCSHG